MFTGTTAATTDYSTSDSPPLILDSTTAKWNRPTAEAAPSCPRCASANTKFCYYNNYSLSQPRYFCKACRRYWTKGGSLRNIPIGGGCRKTRRARAAAKPPRPAVPESAASIDLAAVFAKYVNQSAAAGAEESFNSSDNYNCSNRVDSLRGGDYDHPTMDGQDYTHHDFSGFDQLMQWSEGTTGFDGAHVQPMMQVQDFELISPDDDWGSFFSDL